MVDRERRDDELTASYTERMIINMRSQLDVLRSQIDAERGDMYTLKADLRELKAILTEREKTTEEWRREIRREVVELQTRVERLRDGRGGSSMLPGNITPLHLATGVGIGGAFLFYKLVLGG